jgi:hypothetical protein
MKRLVTLLFLVLFVSATPQQSSGPMDNIASISILAQDGGIYAKASYINEDYCPNGICDVLMYSAFIYFQSCTVDSAFYRHITQQMLRRLSEQENREDLKI